MAKTILVEKIGGPEVMQLVDVELGKPGPGELRLRHKAVGINFMDVHYRRGTASPHAMAKLPWPFTPGLEAVAIVEDVGPDVTQFKIGDRVGYAAATLTTGAYAEARLFPAELTYKIPTGISDLDAASLVYRGITVHSLIRSCYPVKPGDVVLIQAAAGGVGSVMARWCNKLGATVIGTVSSDAKADYARSHGCHHVIVVDREDFVARSRELTDGRGVDVAFDGIGGDTFLRSFDCLKKFGTMVSFGQTSGVMDPIDPVMLQHNGLYLAKFSGSTYNAEPPAYQRRVAEVLEAIEQGVLVGEQGAVFSLDQVAQAHRDLEDRRTTGALVIQM
jgi:NADPH:quinone reductase